MRCQQSILNKSLLITLCLHFCLLQASALSGRQNPVSQADFSLLKDAQMHVFLIGTGSPLPDATRASACTAIFAGGEFVLVDIGPGAWRKVALNNLPAQNLSAVLLTHFHSDHLGDLGEATMQSWVAGRKKALDIYGPPGIEKVVGGFAQAYSLDTEYRIKHHGEGNLPRIAAGMLAHPVNLKSAGTNALVFERNGLKIEAFKVEHDPATPACLTSPRST